MSEIAGEYAAVEAQLTAPGAPWELAQAPDGSRFYRNAPADLIAATDVARQHGDREFLVYEGERRSFNRLMDEADALGAALQGAGIAPGDRVAIAMRNYPEWMAAFLAVVRSGSVVVPLNSWGRPAEIAANIEDAGAKLVFCDQPRFDGLADWLSAHGVPAIIARPERVDDPRGMPAFTVDCAGRAPAPVAVAGDDLAMIMYTSGTSGRPRGAASTHRAIAQALYNFDFAAAAAAMTNRPIINAMRERGFEPTSLLAVPLFHVSGCHAQFLASLRGGRRIVMMYKWDADRALDHIAQERVTGIAAAPAMILDLLESPRFVSADTRSLCSVGIGGAATPTRLSRVLHERIPRNFSGTGWGMTETNAQGTSFTGRAFEAKPGSAGFLHPIVALRICDETGAELPPGKAGEIYVRSCCCIREYWHRPQANAQDFRNGWLKTGDMGYLDEDGCLFLADRARDMVIRGGENIYPAEVENALLKRQEVREVAVIGLPHERWGEEVAAVARLQPGASLGESELLAHARDELAAFKVPSRFFFTREPLPRNASDKLLKGEIRRRILTELNLPGE